MLFGVAALLYGVNSRFRGADLEMARVVSGELVALDSEGRHLWKKNYAPPLRSNAYDWKWPIRDMVWTGDLDGDGKREVVFSADLELDGQGYLFCYSNDGTERWKYRPDLKLRTAQKEIPNNWIPSGLAVGSTRPNGPIRIWVSFASRHSSPSVVVRLSQSGVAEGAYVHSGHLPVLKLWDRGPGANTVLLAGGVNNRHNMATLVSLDPDQLSGVSSEPGSPDEQLLGELSKSEIRRIFFPRTVLNRELAAYNHVREILTAAGRLDISTDEDPVSETGARAIVRYGLDPDFGVLDARFTDIYASVHHKYFAQRRLRADFDQTEIAKLRGGCLVEAGGSQPGGRSGIGDAQQVKATLTAQH